MDEEGASGMTDIRALSPGEMAQAIRGSDAVFRDAEQTSMGLAFSSVFSAALSQSLGAFEDGRLVSFMGLVPGTLRIGAAHVPIFSIGSVFTGPDDRGRGHAGRLLQAAKSHVRASGGALILVSGTRSLYLRNQCHSYGETTRFAIGPVQGEELLGTHAGIAVRELSRTDWLHLHALAASRHVAYAQTVRELAELIASEAYASCFKLRHRTLVATEGDRIAAFAVLAMPDERGSEQEPFAVEWAGEAGALAALFGHAVVAYGLPRLDVPVAWHETGLLQALSGVPSAKDRNLGTVHIADAERLFESLAPYWHAAAASDVPRIRTLAHHRYALAAPDGGTFELDAETLVSLMFDPVPAQPAALEARAAMPGLFPVPLPYAGGLNFV
ncbi:GNAT family N-acetyltransferase [Cohnella rhizosphaerae]|uniref:GNAT family N-acetyltransferase n=1 Tax=Cohnella rhizosphaerae TaxID=1457232 RepID=A0A9X4KYV7_9BACL|nr:GNAT family N-acetyltransferase [Cohnella rhizosphaerae]MDG0813023.1 GNAT family N-acetyltransferase [Cohnella rhizosphaerae]